MQEILTSLSTYGYILLFVYSLGGGMVGIIAAGVLSYIGKMDIGICIAVATLGNFVGDSLIFYFTRYSKTQIMPYLRKQRRSLALSQILFKKYGILIILVKKYLYGIKTIIPIAIALTKFPFVKFSIINAITSLIWAASLGMLSFYMGEYIGDAYEYMKSKFWILLLGVLIILLVVYVYFKTKTKKQ